MKRFRFLHSLRVKMLLWAVGFIAPILIILVSSILNAANSFEEQVQNDADAILTPYVAVIDSTLSTAKLYVADLGSKISAYFSPVDDEMGILERRRDISELVAQDLTLYPEIDVVFIYEDDELFFIQNSGQSYTDNSAAALALSEIFAERDPTASLYQSGYQYFESDGRYYLYIAIESGDSIAGCWFNTESLFQEIEDAALEGLEYVVIASSSGRILNSEFYTPSANKRDELLEPYLVTSNALSAAGFSVKGLWNRDVIFAPVQTLRNAIYLSIGVALLLFALYIVFVNGSLIHPINRLVRSIDGVQEDPSRRIPMQKREDFEFVKVYTTINNMISQIENLKIEMYEEKLAKQKVQMQLFQLQIRPHFFLNALNTIISYARIQDYEMVQKMTVCLATQFRYLLYNSWYVSVDEELTHTQNFIDMQSAQHGQNYQYSVQAPDEVLDYEIPILTVQIFVENSIKHAAVPGRPIEIRVSISEIMDGGEQKLQVVIEDTGKGFDAETLAAFSEIRPGEEADARHNEGPDLRADHGVGIANVRQRMWLLYGARGSMTLSNRPEGGACIQLLFPIDHPKEV